MKTLKKFKKIKKIYISMTLVSVMCILSLTGCGSVKYTEEQEDIIANYAANLLLKHDKRYKYNYISEEYLMTESTADNLYFENETESYANDGNEAESNTISDDASVTGAFHMPAGITAEYLDYDITDRYPSDNSDNELFVMKSVDNYKLLVVRFRITNTTGQDIALNMMSLNSKYRGIVNDTKKYNAQLTLLLDALNTYEGTITAGSSENLVLIYQTQIDSKNDVNSLSIAVSDTSGNETVIKLK